VERRAVARKFRAGESGCHSGDLKSPILIHPLTQDAGGDFFHSGGKHFNSQSDPEWLTLKAFVMGKTAGGQ